MGRKSVYHKYFELPNERKRAFWQALIRRWELLMVDYPEGIPPEAMALEDGLAPEKGRFVMKPYGFCIVEEPTIKGHEEGVEPKVVAQGTVLAENQQDAILKAGQQMPEGVAASRVKVYLNPF